MSSRKSMERTKSFPRPSPMDHRTLKNTGATAHLFQLMQIQNLKQEIKWPERHRQILIHRTANEPSGGRWQQRHDAAFSCSWQEKNRSGAAIRETGLMYPASQQKFDSCSSSSPMYQYPSVPEYRKRSPRAWTHKGQPLGKVPGTKSSAKSSNNFPTRLSKQQLLGRWTKGAPRNLGAVDPPAKK